MTIFCLRRAVLINAAALLTGLAAGAAYADTTLTYAGVDGEYTVYMRSDDIRIDGTGSQWQLYKRADPAILSVNPSDQSYTRLDKSAASNIRHQMDSLRAQVETRLQQLPPSQRAAARQAMAARIPGLDGKQHSVGLDRTGDSDKVAGVSCQLVQIVRDGQPAERMCVASAKALNISHQSFTTAKSMFKLLQSMLKGTGLEGIGLPYQSLSGMPVRFVDGVSGRQRSLVKVSHHKIADSRFEIPGSYIQDQLSPNE